MAFLKKNRSQLYSRLVETAGVYLFLNQEKFPIYIGKAINLRARIKQHFTNKDDAKEQLIAKNTAYLKIIETNSEFAALVLEANLIGKYLPKYNAVGRDNKSRLYIVITKDEYPKLALERRQNFKHSDHQFIFGPLNSAQTGRALLRRLRQITPFCTEKRLSSKPCFYSQIGLCSPCPNQIISEASKATQQKLKKQYLKNIARAKKILQGDGQKILADLKTELASLSEELRYEEAILVRNRLHYLELLFQKRLVFDQRLSEPNYIEALRFQEVEELRVALSFAKLERVECYDISNLNFKEATASMVVFNKGKAIPDEYRRFKIKGARRFDPEMLLEVVVRRLAHRNWSYPDLIMIDGGSPQLLKVIPDLKQRYADLPLIVGLAKRPDRLLLLKELGIEMPQLGQGALRFLARMRDEAHRFAKKYHIFLRRQKLRADLEAIG